MKYRATDWVGLKGAAVAVACCFALPAYAQEEASDEAAEAAEEATDAVDEAAEDAEEAMDAAEDALEGADDRAEPALGSVTPDVGAEDLEEPEKIVVTGTRIGRSNVSSYAPIRIITSQQLQNSGITTLDEFLFRLPSVSQQGITRFNNNGGDGIAQVDLRNLTPVRTLVLVNGRRFVGPGGVVDFNTIPVAMVDRVEVLLDGASAIYGADAVAGVINIITKKDFQGVEANVFSGISQEGDGEQLQASVTVGETTDRGSFIVSAQYLNRQEIEQSDRDWAREPITDWLGNDFETDGQVGSSFIPEGRAIYRGPDELDSGFGQQVFRPDPATGQSFQPFGRDTRYNYGQEQWLSGRLETFNITAEGQYDINDYVTVYSEGFFNHRTSRQRLAPSLLDITTTTDNPLIPRDYLEALAGAGANIDPVTGLDPTGNPQEIGIARRMTEVGNRFFAQEVSTFRMLTGVKGDIGEWNYDFYLGGGQNNVINQIRNSSNQVRAAELADPAAVAGGCNGRIGCNGLADYFGRDTLSQESVDYISFTQRNTDNYAQFLLGGTTSGTLLELPAGDLGLALGFVYRDERQEAFVDSETANGEDAGNFAQNSIGGFDVFEVFAETAIPIVAGVPGVHDLSANLAGRFSDFSTFGSEFTYRVGLTYAPIDWVRLRGNYSTTFRAPNIDELFQGATESFESVQDPCDGVGTGNGPNPDVETRCFADGVPSGFDQASTGTNQVSTNVGGNTGLEAEEAVYWSGGLIVTPPFFEDDGVGITITSDYYDYDVDNSIITPTEQSILDRCYILGDQNACANIQRDSVTGGITSL
ncbi:MAG: TonB-dependent receptor, partial [Myxococcota bacterium]